jgi:hypothetical protein
MFSCIRRSDSDSVVTESISSSPHKKVKPRNYVNEILEYVSDSNKHRRKRYRRLRFLILLRDEDYDKCFYSRRDWIQFRKSKFPGKLILDRFSESDTLPYNIEGPPIPRQVYIMLPKERIFIPSQHFTSRYMDSKLSELKSIFVALHAEKIRFSKTTKSEEQYSGGTNIGINLPRIGDVGSDVQVESKNTNVTMYWNEMTFGEPTTIIEPNIFNTFFYLDQEYEWQQIIVRRLKYSMIKDKYVYKNRENELFNASTLQTLRRLNLSIDYDWSKVNDVEIHYEIMYHDIHNE